MGLTSLLSRGQPRLLDGAMGTQLAAVGLEMGGQTCLTHPEAVAAVHRAYVDCGADVLITNTLTMNRVYIESHHPGLDVREVNLAGARLARGAAMEQCRVLGDLSATGQMLEPYGAITESVAAAAFREQAEALVEGGVDGLLIETMFDLREALCALRACRDVTDLPVIVSMAFRTPIRGGRTLMGDSARACAEVLTDGGAAAVGANCGDVTPVQLAAIVATMRAATALPIIAQPNAGIPRLVDRQTVFDLAPSDFAAGIAQCVEAGARLVGGCCGTTPTHISAVAEMLNVSRGFV